MKIKNFRFFRFKIINLFIILLFLIIPLFSPNFISAQTSTPIITQAITPDAIDIISLSPLGFLLKILLGHFIKTDYQIGFRSFDAKNQDMNDYGNYNDENFKKKYSFAGSRLTSLNSQICLKGNIIRKVVLGTYSGYSNIDLSKICSDSSAGYIVKNLDDNTSTECTIIDINDLANYFVQLNKPFYCDYINDIDQLIEIETDVINKVKSLALPEIPEIQKKYYQQIYDDLYLTPKDNKDVHEKNAKNIVRTPIPAKDQVTDKDVKDIKKQLDANFNPYKENDWDGLDSLIPESEKK